MALQAHEDRRARHRPQAGNRRLVGGQLSGQGAEPQLLPRALVDAYRDGRAAPRGRLWGWGVCPRGGRMSRMWDILQLLTAPVPVWQGAPPFDPPLTSVLVEGRPLLCGPRAPPPHAVAP